METDNKFTEFIKKWLETPTNERDYAIVMLYLLKLLSSELRIRILWLHQEMLLAQVGSPLVIENTHKNLLDMEDDE